MKIKIQKYKSTRNWARGCKKEKGGVKSSQAKPSPKLHLQPLAFEKTRACPVQTTRSCIRALLQKHTTSNL